MFGRAAGPCASLTLAIALASCGDGGSPPTSGAPSTSRPAPAATAATVPGPTTAGLTWPVEAETRQVEFSSDGFQLAGDLALPGGDGPYPAVIVVHGSGPQTRTSTPGYWQVMQKFQDAGYAVLSWDKPGSGSSTGEFESGETLRQRAAILADGIDFLAEDPMIDAARIGLWGLSQAGWVMPLALELDDRPAFMISVSGGGEDSIEQGSYELGQRLVCNGLTPEEGELIADWGPQAAKGTTYESYIEAMEILLAIGGVEQYIGEVADEDDWQPWPSHIDAYFDPMDVISHTTIPVLAVFGELDKAVDPVQGAAAYERALQEAGNGNYHVELIPGVGHTMLRQTTGCASDPGGTISPRYLELLDEFISRLGN